MPIYTVNGELSRAEEYRSNDFLGTREARIKKLKVKLREHIRSLHYNPCFADDWIKMSDSISQVAEVAFMEMSIPFKSNNCIKDVQGRKKDGTLWDQEDDQMAIKILLEEGKINLCARLLDEYNDEICKESREEIVDRVGKTSSFDKKLIGARIDQFEKGMGIIMHLAIQHEEVLQILDVPTFINYIAKVLRTVDNRAPLFEAGTTAKFSSNFNGLDKMQESTVFCFLASIGHHIEKLDEERIVNLLDNNEILQLSINHMAKHHEWYASDVIAAFFVFLHHVFDSETYTADKEQFISENSKKGCLHLYETVLSGVLKETKISNRDVMRFSDNCKGWKFEKEQFRKEHL